VRFVTKEDYEKIDLFGRKVVHCWNCGNKVAVLYRIKDEAMYCLCPELNLHSICEECLNKIGEEKVIFT